MPNFIDRRLNPAGKSLSNRRRFIDRVRNHVKQAVDEAVRKRGIADVDRGGNVSVPSESISEPHFQHAAEGGQRERVLPGNKEFRAGDRIKKPPSGGGRGSKGAPDGDSEDSFVFVLTRDEFLDFFFEDLELPDMVKRSLKGVEATEPHRSGISISGTPGNLNLKRTMRNAYGRRLALKRPSDKEVSALLERVFALEAVHEPDAAQRDELAALRARLEELLQRQKSVPYLDPLDVRYNYFEPKPRPIAKAVMFCLMDVSASMTERDKNLAKKFFVLLHLFLLRQYEKVELVFIRHTHHASEVDEETFFYSRESGGTVVSSALKEMKRVIDERYSPADWNIYAAQASDGDNFADDSAHCVALLDAEIMTRCQYFAYVEIIAEAEADFLRNEANGTELWRAYRSLGDRENFAMKRISRAGDILPVFRELFARRAGGVDDG